MKMKVLVLLVGLLLSGWKSMSIAADQPTGTAAATPANPVTPAKKKIAHKKKASHKAAKNAGTPATPSNPATPAAAGK